MQNLKIRVNSADESKEAQELLFELGVQWRGLKSPFDLFYPTSMDNYYILLTKGSKEMQIAGAFRDGLKAWKEITLAELRAMANQDQDEPFLTPECTLNDQYAEIEKVRQHNHYFKDVSGLSEIDVYMVLKLFNVTDPCLQHIAKKMLSAGQRGHKVFKKDLQDILDTAKRAVEINNG